LGSPGQKSPGHSPFLENRRRGRARVQKPKPQAALSDKKEPNEQGIFVKKQGGVALFHFLGGSEKSDFLGRNSPYFFCHFSVFPGVVRVFPGGSKNHQNSSKFHQKNTKIMKFSSKSHKIHQKNTKMTPGECRKCLSGPRKDPLGRGKCAKSQKNVTFFIKNEGSTVGKNVNRWENRQKDTAIRRQKYKKARKPENRQKNSG
jgi:hypothetical protein